MYYKDFDKWNSLKKELNSKENKTFFHHREVWWCAVGINIGVESDGKHENKERPVLIIHKFNNDMFWGIPLTSQAKSGPAFQYIQHAKKESWAVIAQLRIFSTKRLLRKIDTISSIDFRYLQEKLINLIKNRTP